MPTHRLEALRQEHVPQLLPQEGQDQEGMGLSSHPQISLLFWYVPELLPCQVLHQEKVEARAEGEGGCRRQGEP